jgi:gliding motility-associated-like protein
MQLNWIIVLIFLLSIKICANAQYKNCNFLCNTDFEDDTLVRSGQFGFFHQDRVSCWNTTATDNMIEIWGSGFNGVKAYSGNQFAELNANMVSTLFQNFNAALGSTVMISFAHRGRAGIDRLRVEIGPTTGPFQILGTYTANNTKWEYNKISYTLPNIGSKNYTLRFVSVSAAGGNIAIGNFLDAISIQLPQPKINVDINNATCPFSNDGGISIMSKSGAQPFRYLWAAPINSTDSTLQNIPPGKYSVSVIDFYGCALDTSIEILATHKIDTTIINKSVCSSFYWPIVDKNFEQSGIYYASLQNRFSCDSIIVLNLKVYQNDTSTITFVGCDSFTWMQNKLTYTRSGKYSFSLQNTNLCDSIIVLDLTINKSHILTDSVQTCEKYTWPVNHQEYTKSGVYNEHFVTSQGCDSIHQLFLKINKPLVYKDSARSCVNYTWPYNLKTYTKSGIYSDTLMSAGGCDTIIILDLTINNSHLLSDSIQTCEKYTWPVNHQEYTKSGVYKAHFVTNQGCDSVHQLFLKINKPIVYKDSASSCLNYTWPYNAKTYARSGIYSDTLLSIHGCDSIRFLDLKIFTPTLNIDTIEACGEYFWKINNKIYNESGVFKANFTDINGCDSIYNLVLNIFPTSQTVQKITACNQYYLKETDTNYTTSTKDSVILNNSNGCDSIIIYNIEINKSYKIYDTVSICNSYFWPVTGKTYSQSGNFISNFLTEKSCDSIHHLHLKINSGYVFYDSVFTDKDYTWPHNNRLYTESSIDQAHFKSVSNCDSIYVLYLIIKRIAKVYVPNVFSPNYDGLNDKFTVYSNDEVKIIDQLRIYDRWGEFIFELRNFPPNDSNFGWDGTFRNRQMNPAVYVYTVDWTDLDGTKRKLSGDVTLLK